jgi:outer membrane protein OmpA-like peptidoglycan-associated protein
MIKQFTFLAACALAVITPLSAQEEQADMVKLRADHERLIDLVLSLEKDFGETLRDYAKLQKDFGEVLKRPEVPDQSGKVKELQKQLKEASARLKEASGQSKVDALVMGDLKALRNELHRERGALLVAKAQLSQFQKLKTQAAELEKLLEAEESRSADSMAKLQVVRGERDALMGRLNEMLKKAEVADKALVAANQKIQVLEKEAGVLKVQIAQRDTEIAELKKKPMPDKAMMAAVEKLQNEGAKLANDLQVREKELETLRTALAAEKKRALDVPILLKARKDLEARLATSSTNLEKTQAKLIETEKVAATAEALKKENTELVNKFQRLAGDFEALTGMIAGMEAELAKTREEMMEAIKAGMQVKDLEMEKGKLTRNLEDAKARLATVENELKLTTEKLSVSQEKVKVAEAVSAERDDLSRKLMEATTQMKKSAGAVAAAGKLKADYDALSARAAELEKQKTALEMDLAKRDGDLKALRAEMVEKPDMLKKVAQLEAEKEDVILNYKAMLAAQLDLKRNLDETSMQLRKASEAAAVAEQLRADYAVLAERAAALEKEKADLVVSLAKGGEAMKALQVEMIKNPDMVTQLAKLEDEKKKLEVQLATREADLKKARMDLGKLHLNSEAMEKQLVSLKRTTAQVEPVRYAKGEADVNDQQTRVLGQVQGVLKAYPSARFEIVGHTCDLGSRAGNLRLSKERAKSLHDFLVQKGIPENRLKSRGVADAEPVVPNTNEENRRKNRRVEIEILD